MKEIAEEIARKVEAIGGRAYYVGGCVRDSLIDSLTQPKDLDIEVYGVEVPKLRELLQSVGKVDEVGASFAVFKVGQDIDVSIPRREKKTGEGHKGFTVEGDPYMTFHEACSRRDFTINAVMQDVLTGGIIDPYNGSKDIENGILRAVSSKSFQEDSLRVLRLVQFAARFDFVVEEETARMAKETYLGDLPKERIWTEIEKLLMKSTYHYNGLKLLESLKVREKVFPKLRITEHGARALAKARHYINDLSYPEKLTVMLATMLVESEADVADYFDVCTVQGFKVREQVKEIVSLVAYTELFTSYSFYLAAQDVIMKLASRVLYAHRSNFSDKYPEYFAYMIERLGIEERPPEPILKGRHLIEMGFAPGEEFGHVLAETYDMQLQEEITDLEDAKAYAVELFQ